MKRTSKIDDVLVPNIFLSIRQPIHILYKIVVLYINEFHFTMGD